MSRTSWSIWSETPGTRHGHGTTLLEAQDAMVGDRDAMGVGAEVGEHAVGSRERWLGVDDPVDAAKLAAKHRGGGVVFELSPFEGLLETFEEFRPKHPGEGSAKGSGIAVATVTKTCPYSRSFPLGSS